MLVKTSETKVFRDVIHNYIHIDLQVIWDLINTKEMQRLRRIHQLGGAYQVYHNAEHSRFSHSLGVYEIVRRMVNEIDDIKESLSSYEKCVVMIAALLHDVGHLPFSHSFENICPTKHEEFSCRIVLGDTEINQVLRKYNKKLPKDVANVINSTHHNMLLNQLISGQLDADRMDYLLRDAYFSGTSYGKFDLERIFRTIRVEDNCLMVKESGIHAVENYIIARYHMYWQVYYHPVCRSFERILETLFKRMKYLYQNNDEQINQLKMFTPFLEDKQSVHDHYLLDENSAMYGISILCTHQDPIISDLASRIMCRKLFQYKTITTDHQKEKIRKKVSKYYDSDYYLLSDKASQSPYQPYDSDSSKNIMVLCDNGKKVELSKRSDIVHSLVRGKIKEERKVFYPREVKL